MKSDEKVYPVALVIFVGECHATNRVTGLPVYCDKGLAHRGHHRGYHETLERDIKWKS